VHHLSKSDVGDLALLLSLGAMFGLLADGGYSIVLQAVVRVGKRALKNDPCASSRRCPSTMSDR